MNNKFQELDKLNLIYAIKYHNNIEKELLIKFDLITLLQCFKSYLSDINDNIIEVNDFIYYIMGMYYSVYSVYNDSEKSWINFYIQLNYLFNNNKLLQYYNDLPLLNSDNQLILQIAFRIKNEIAKYYIKTNQQIPEDLMNDIRNYPKDNLIPGI